MRIQPHSVAARLRGIAALLTLVALGGCDMIVMNPTGDVAMQQRDLILIATGLMLLIIVPVLILVVVFAYRYRKGAGGTYDPHFDHSTQLELVIWACPLLIIIALGAVTWSSTHLLDPFRGVRRIAPGQPVAADVKPLEVQVVALDWKWLFIYPQQGVASVNELALPTNVPVRFTITSTSQMNAFFAPTLAGMIYAMPGMQSELNAVLNKPGESWGFSGNYSGRGFSDMRFLLKGFDQTGFDKWVAGLKSAGGALAADTYMELAQPSENNKVASYASVAPGLFDRVVNRCVVAGKPCIADVMSRDESHGGGTHMPPAGAAIPMPGQKPVPALQKTPEEFGVSPNVTKPPAPLDQVPGPLAPGDQRNRDHSELMLHGTGDHRGLS